MLGVIFDFNGTLFKDEQQQIETWQKFSQRYANRRLTEEELQNHVHGQNNSKTISYIFNGVLSSAELKHYSSIKDQIYRSVCLEEPSKCKLAPGANLFLDKLKKAKIPMTIATGSIKSNVDFYFSEFDLNQWFDKDLIVWDNGELRSKPEPDLFIAAMNKLKIKSGDAIIFEDSRSGITAAKRSGSKYIVGISNDTNRYDLIEDTDISDVIDDYTIKSKYLDIDFLKSK